MRLQLIVSTVNLVSIENKLKQMNLTNVPNNVYVTIINQCSYDSKVYYSDSVEIINTASLGTANSRNIGTSNIKDNVDFVLFTDDDVSYIDGFEEKLKMVLTENKSVEVVVFNVNSLTLDRKIKDITRVHKLHNYNIFRYGMYNLAIKADVIKKLNIKFNTDFGGGAKYLTGEDTLFIYELFKSKAQMYAYPICIAEVNHKESTWHKKEFSKEYFTSKGALFCSTGSRIYKLFMIYFALKHYKKSIYSFLEVLKLLNIGAKECKKEVKN